MALHDDEVDSCISYFWGGWGVVDDFDASIKQHLKRVNIALSAAS